MMRRGLLVQASNPVSFSGQVTSLMRSIRMTSSTSATGSVGMVRDLSVPRLHMANGIAYEVHSKLAQPGNARDSTLLTFVHGNGLSRGIFREMAKYVLGMYPANKTVHAILIDLGGHGASFEKDTSSRTKVGDMAEDVAGCVNDVRSRLDIDRTVLVGHSIGAHASLIAATRQSDLFQEAFLIEPMIHASWSPENRPTFLIEGSKRRRKSFLDRNAALEYFSTRGIFQYWDRRCIEDFVDTGLRPIDPSKPELTLSCTPVLEAETFSMDVSEVFSKLESIHLKKVEVLEGVESGYCPPDVLRVIASKLEGSYSAVEGGRHVMQSEMPKQMAERLITFLSRDAAKSRL